LRNGVADSFSWSSSPDEYGSAVEETNDYGIPYNRALGRQLSTPRINSAGLAPPLLPRRLRPTLLRIFSSPFTKFSEDTGYPAPDKLRRAGRSPEAKTIAFALMHFRRMKERHPLRTLRIFPAS
jgi:hypothetical protein